MPESVGYSATVTLKSRMYDDDPSVQYDKSSYALCLILNTMASRYMFVAELTKSANIHYHILMYFRHTNCNLMVAFCNAFRKSKVFGYVNIKQLTDEDGWLSYITKDMMLTRNAIGRPPICVHEYEFDTSKINKDELEFMMMVNLAVD